MLTRHLETLGPLSDEYLVVAEALGKLKAELTPVATQVAEALKRQQTQRTVWALLLLTWPLRAYRGSLLLSITWLRALPKAGLLAR